MVDTSAMSRPVAVLTAVLALALAGFGLLVGLAQTTIHYSLPTRSGGISRHTAVFVPGVVAAVVAAVAVLGTVIWLVLAALGRSARWMVLAVVGLLAVDAVVLAVVLGMSRPTF
jgi:hypothetical protein